MRNHQRIQAILDQAIIDNPDLPVLFIQNALMSMAESRDNAVPFIPKVCAISNKQENFYRDLKN